MPDGAAGLEETSTERAEAVHEHRELRRERLRAAELRRSIEEGRDEAERREREAEEDREARERLMSCDRLGRGGSSVGGAREESHLPAGVEREKRRVAEVRRAGAAPFDVREDGGRHDVDLSVGHRREDHVARVASGCPYELLREEVLLRSIRHDLPPTLRGRASALASSSSASAIALRPRVTHVATVPSGTSRRAAISWYESPSM